MNQPADSSGEISRLRALLETPTAAHRLSPEMERDFRAHMVEQGLQLNRNGAKLTLLAVPVAYLILNYLVRVLSTPGYVDANLDVLNMAFIAEFFFALMIVIMGSLPAVRKLYPLYTVFSWSGLVAVAFITSASFTDRYVSALSCCVASTLMLTIFALGVFDKRLSALSAILGVLVAFSVIKIQGLWFDAGFFITSAILPIGVGMIIADLIEMRDRTSFLQGRLLAAEKSLIDRYAAEVEVLSRSDALTGLANRRHFNETLEREWSLACRKKQEIALVFIDIDYFKPFNDSYGHLEGDRTLAAVGQALAQCTKRPSDLAARYGGEEFVVLLPDTTLEGAHAVARLIDARVAELGIPHGASKVSGRVTLSIGVAAMLPGDENTSRELTAAADAAAYAAKNAGRNRIMLATASSGQTG